MTSARGAATAHAYNPGPVTAPVIDLPANEVRTTAGAPCRWREGQMVALLIIHLAVRGLFLLITPAGASNDVSNWLAVAAALRNGENPYVTTPFLNHPPFWMQWIFV